MPSVKEAAERLRRNEYVYEASTVNYNFSQKRMNDVCELADAYLAEHPADGEEAIDEAWLLSVGFRPWDIPEEDPQFSLYMPMQSELGSPCRLAYQSNGFYAVRMIDPDIDELVSESVELLGRRNMNPRHTRQDVRNLCRALGVSLTEQREKGGGE